MIINKKNAVGELTAPSTQTTQDILSDGSQEFPSGYEKNSYIFIN